MKDQLYFAIKMLLFLFICLLFFTGVFLPEPKLVYLAGYFMALFWFCKWVDELLEEKHEFEYNEDYWGNP
jgi:hypothetical protein